MKAVGLGRSSVSRLAEYSIVVDGPFSVGCGTHQQPIYQRVGFIRLEVRRKLRHRNSSWGRKESLPFSLHPGASSRTAPIRRDFRLRPWHVKRWRVAPNIPFRRTKVLLRACSFAKSTSENFYKNLHHSIPIYAIISADNLFKSGTLPGPIRCRSSRPAFIRFETPTRFTRICSQSRTLYGVGRVGDIGVCNVSTRLPRETSKAQPTKYVEIVLVPEVPPPFVVPTGE